MRALLGSTAHGNVDATANYRALPNGDVAVRVVVQLQKDCNDAGDVADAGSGIIKGIMEIHFISRQNLAANTLSHTTICSFLKVPRSFTF